LFETRQRDALRDAVLGLARADDRVVAGAAVGSLAVDAGDRFSDLDLTFGIADRVAVGDVLDEWAAALRRDHGALVLADLTRGSTTYRVLLLPGALQLDLSMTPARDFRPGGPRFRLLFGSAGPEADAPPAPAAISIPTPATATDLYGWGVIYALHARACVARGRPWQAEHYIGAVRDHGLALACLRHGLPAVQARAYDDLPAETLQRFAATHVTTLEPAELRRALAAGARALLDEGRQARLDCADAVAERLADML
jgi:hypothetical protein